MENPQAFPTLVGRNSLGFEEFIYPGMTLRDYLAGQALAGLTSGGAFREQFVKDNVPIYEISMGCYKLADAMLKEGSKQNAKS